MSKIAIISPCSPPNIKGGISSAQYELFLGIRHISDVRYFTYDDTISSHEDVKIIEETSSKKFKKIVLILVFPYKIISLLFWAARYSYNLHSHLRIWQGVRRMNRKIIEFNPDIIIIPDHDVPLKYIDKNLKIKTKIILGIHHVTSRFNRLSPYVPRQSRLDELIIRLIERSQLKYVDCAIAPSKYIKEHFTSTYKTFGKNIHIIPNFYNYDDNNKESHKISNTVNNVLLTGIGDRIKGYYFFPEFIRQIEKSDPNKWVIHTVGEISNKQKSVISKKSKNNVNVIHHGYLHRDDYIDLVKKMNYFVSLSISESFGMTAIEAIFNGVPVIGFNQGAYDEIIKDGINGFIVKFGDVDGIVKKLLMRKEFDKDDMRNTLNEFMPEFLINKYLKVIEEL